VVLALVWKPREWQRAELVLVVALAGFLGLLVFAASTFMRYALPLAPLLAVLVVRPLPGLGRRKIAVAGWLVLLVAEPAYAALHVRVLLSGPDTRTQVHAWLQAHPPRGGRLLSVPACGGEVRLLNPRSVCAREIRFAGSLGVERLARAYAVLSQRRDLSPFYAATDLTHLRTRLAPPGVAAADSALVLWYQHPLCPLGADSLALSQLFAHVDWQAEFSPGQVGAAAFDRMDAYFLPIGNWSGVEGTGAAIRVGKLPLDLEEEVPDAREYFALLHQCFSGYRAVHQKDWPAVIRAYEAVLDTPFFLNELMPFGRLYQLLVNLGVAYEHTGRTAQARACFSKALELAPAHPQAALLQKKLQVEVNVRPEL